MNKYRIIAICGKSAAGKDTLLQSIIQNNPEVHEIISCTTRPPREGEIDGKNYFFLTPTQFTIKCHRGEMLESSKFRDWYYGTAIDGLNPNLINVGVFNPTGICNLLENEEVDVYVVMVEAPGKVRLLRSLNREINPDVDEIVRRYMTDKKDFEDFSAFYEPDFIFDNSQMSRLDIELTSHKVVSLARCHWAEKAN